MWGRSALVSNSWGLAQGMYLALVPDLGQPLSLAASAGPPTKPMVMATVASTMPTLLRILIVSAFMSVDESGVLIQEHKSEPRDRSPSGKRCLIKLHCNFMQFRVSEPDGHPGTR